MLYRLFQIYAINWLSLNRQYCHLFLATIPSVLYSFVLSVLTLLQMLDFCMVIDWITGPEHFAQYCSKTRDRVGRDVSQTRFEHHWRLDPNHLHATNFQAVLSMEYERNQMIEFCPMRTAYPTCWDQAQVISSRPTPTWPCANNMSKRKVGETHVWDPGAISFVAFDKHSHSPFQVSFNGL